MSFSQYIETMDTSLTELRSKIRPKRHRGVEQISALRNKTSFTGLGIMAWGKEELSYHAWRARQGAGKKSSCGSRTWIMRCSPILQSAEGFSQWWELVVPSLWSPKPKCSYNAFKRELPVIPPRIERKNTLTLPAAEPPYSFQYMPTGWCPLSLSELTMLFTDSSRVQMWPWFRGEGQNRPWPAAPMSHHQGCITVYMLLHRDPCHCLC